MVIELKVGVFSLESCLLDHEIFVSPLTCLSLNTADGSLLRLLTLKIGETTIDLNDRFLVASSQLHSQDAADTFDDSIVYVTRACLFNLCNAREHGQMPQEDDTVSLAVSTETGLSPSHVGFARSVSVKAIACGPTYDAKAVDAAVKLHFAKSKLYSRFDVLGVHFEDDNDSAAVAWFLIDGIESEKLSSEAEHVGSRWVNSKESSLQLNGSANSYVPYSPLKGNSSTWKHCAVSLRPHTMNIHAVLKSVGRGVNPKELCLLLHGPRGSGKCHVIRDVASRMCMTYIEFNCFNIVSETIAASESRLDKMFAFITKCSPSIVLFRNIHTFGRSLESGYEESRSINCFRKHMACLNGTFPTLIVCSTSKLDDVTPGLLTTFTYRYEITNPSEDGRREIFEGVKASANDASLHAHDLARRTAGMALGDIAFVLETSLMSELGYASVECDRPLSEEIADHLAAFCKDKSDSLGLAKVPQVNWEDIGGLASVKTEILDTIDLPMKFPELVANGLRRSGLLFYGPPGCGKTLLAKAVATEFQLNFLSVKGPELINMYVGQSEENVRAVFQRGRDFAPCVIFFDELDSLAPNRGRSGDSGGVSDRIVSQLLAELDGLSSNANVFVVGATNRPDLLDPALLRPGRFDKMVYVGISASDGDRMKILQSLTRKMDLSQDVDLLQVAQLCHAQLTGADLYAICADAVTCAIKREVASLQAGASERSDGPEHLIITMSDLSEAATRMKPSVSSDDLRRYQQIKHNAK